MSTEHNGDHEIGMTPPAPTAPAASAASTSAPRKDDSGSGSSNGSGSGGRAIGILLGVIGGVVLLGACTSAAFAAGMNLGPRHDTSESVDVAGVNELRVDVGASDLTIEFRDVDEAELAIEGGRDSRWVLTRDDDELVVRTKNEWFGWWFRPWFAGDERVTLTLPENLAGLDAQVEVGAGAIDMDGDFGALDVTLGAGHIEVGGSAESVDAKVSAGRMDLQLDGVSEAEFTVSAGDLVGELTGTAPDSVTIDVSAGSLSLELPDVQYRVSQNVSAGSVDNDLDTSSSARNTIDVQVAAGSAALRPAD